MVLLSQPYMAWRDSQVCSDFHPPSLWLVKSMASSSICQGYSQGETDLVLALVHVFGLPTVSSESGQLVTLITKDLSANICYMKVI